MAFNEKDRAFLRSLTFQSFYHFCKIAGGYTKQGGDISPYIHGPLCKFAQDRTILRKQIIMPRNWRKSTVFTQMRALWEYLHNPEIRILVAAENAFLAGRMMAIMQQMILGNALLRWLYPELEKIDAGYTRRITWNKTECVFPRSGIYKEATITNIGVGGAAQSGHYDLILIDDLVGKKAMDSPIVLDSVWMWFDNVQELLLEPSVSEISIVGTFWFEGDFATYALEKYNYHTIIVPALKYEAAIDGWSDELRDKGTLQLINHPLQKDWDVNFPEALDKEGAQLFTKEKYEEMKNNPEEFLKFWTQHMNMPNVPTGLNKFDRRWLRYCTIKEIEIDDQHDFMR